MPVICPSILADGPDQYRAQMDKIAGFAQRIQIDLTDGKFAPNQTVMPDQAWWPVNVKADFHLMYKNPHQAAEIILEHQPNMLIVHSEAEGSFESFAELCRRHGVKVGVALLPQTPAQAILPAISAIDHVLIFSGNLGKYGGRANLDLLKKAEQIKQHSDNVEIGWDGGISSQNISQLAFGGVDVFVVGNFIQSAADPERAYTMLERIAQETGTT